MELYFPFPPEVRLLYLHWHQCFLCGANGWNRGGLQIHHILGRSKYGFFLDSAFNASCLCGTCHEKMGHSQEEEQRLFLLQLEFLHGIFYRPVDKDYRFLEHHHDRIMTPAAMRFLGMK
jgi:hypothetical protein